MEKNILLNQDRAWKKLESQLHHLPGALLLWGPAGVGKKKSVHLLFQQIQCKGPKQVLPCNQCTACQKVLSNHHVDLMEVSLNSASKLISVEDLRGVKKKLAFAPSDSPLRFVIIDNAHLLSTSASNQILKMLEEPPLHTRFFLITAHKDKLLPTILSRCQSIHFQALSRETLVDILSMKSIVVPQHLKELTMDFLGGGMERAFWLQEKEFLRIVDQIQKQLYLALLDHQMDFTPSSFQSPLATEDGFYEALSDMAILLLHHEMKKLVEKNQPTLNEKWRFAFLFICQNVQKLLDFKKLLDRHVNKKGLNQHFSHLFLNALELNKFNRDFSS